MTTQSQNLTWGRVILWVTRFLGGLAVVLLFAMMVLTFVDVWGRYFFNTPVPGGFEITEIMLATLIFAGLPLMTMNSEHITVDLFDRFMPHAVEHVRNGIICLLCGFMMATVSYQLWVRAMDAVTYGDTTAILLIPMAPATFFMCAMSGLTALIFLHHGWIALLKKENPADSRPDEGIIT